VKYIFNLVIALICGILLAACSAQTPPVTVKIATDASLPSLESVNMGTQAIEGFDVDLMRAIAGKAGFEAQFVNVTTSRLLMGIAQCQFDAGISAISITESLKRQIAFSDPYLSFGQTVVVKKGNITIDGQGKLVGMVVGSQNGSPSAVEVMKIPGAQFKAYETYDLAFQDLVTGYIDAVVAEVPRAQSYVNIKANNLKMVGGVFGSDQYGIATCLKKPDLLKKINQGLAVVKADGTLDRLVQKWIKK